MNVKDLRSVLWPSLWACWGWIVVKKVNNCFARQQLSVHTLNFITFRHPDFFIDSADFLFSLRIIVTPNS